MTQGRSRATSRMTRLAESFSHFMHQETSGALVLLAATVIALAIANSGWHLSFEEFWHLHAGLYAGGFAFEQSFKHWVDDALMALFFFVVGLEIKREFIVGELSTRRGATLPVVAAVGGMVVPAAIYVALNATGPGVRGWGVPMATDIAFALGVLALLGSRVPDSLKVFLAALAIADDIGAIIVIALFYAEQISISWLLFAVIPLLVLIAMNRARIDEPIAYLGVASVLWFAVLNSGIHATIAGVVAAFAIPASAKLAPAEFIEYCNVRLDEIAELDVPGAHTLENPEQKRVALDLRRAAALAAAPLQRLEFALHPLSAFVVLPLFALANANIHLVDESIGIGGVGLGVILGLVVGKPLGIIGAVWLATKAGIADLPGHCSWRHIGGVGMLAGVGFTMSLFVANLAFTQAAMITEAKISILIASVIAGVAGWAWLRFGCAGDR